MLKLLCSWREVTLLIEWWELQQSSTLKFFMGNEKPQREFWERYHFSTTPILVFVMTLWEGRGLEITKFKGWTDA